MTKSPCVQRCTLSNGLCTSCYRSVAEIACWSRLNESERQAVLTQALLRKSAATDNQHLPDK